MRVRKIKFKLLLLLGLLLASYAGLSVFLHLSASHVYGNVLNRSIDYTLTLVSAEMDRKLGEIEIISLAIMSGTKFQNLLHLHYDSETVFSRNVTRNAIHDLIAIYQVNTYIRECFVIDTSEQLIVDDDGVFPTDIDDIRHIIALAREHNGKQALYAAGDGGRLLSCRMIRQIDDLSFRSMGTLVIEIDVESMLADTVKNLRGLNLTIGMQFGDNVFLSDNSLFHGKPPRELTTAANGAVFQVENEDYLSYHTRSLQADYAYSVFLPRDIIYEKIDRLNFGITVALLVITAIAAAAGLVLTSHITRPLETLVLRLRRLEDADFADSGVSFTMPRRRDEIGLLYREVEAMFGKINRLINEIYKKQIAIKDNQFRALQAQINPHFLYNTLESINWLARLHGHEDISRMIKSLGNLLRASITRGEYAIALEKEIELVKNYLTIQEMRYTDNLQCNVDVLGDIGSIAVPKLIIQPLVENSIKYSLEYRKQICHINVLAEMDDGSVDITVADDGPGMDARRLRDLNLGRIQPKGSGVGIRNIAERLSLIYGENAYIRVDSKPNAGTTAHLHIPVSDVHELEDRISS